MKNITNNKSNLSILVESIANTMNENAVVCERYMSDDQIRGQFSGMWASDVSIENKRLDDGSVVIDFFMEFPNADGEQFDEGRTITVVVSPEGKVGQRRTDVWLPNEQYEELYSFAKAVVEKYEYQPDMFESNSKFTFAKFDSPNEFFDFIKDYDAEEKVSNVDGKDVFQKRLPLKSSGALQKKNAFFCKPRMNRAKTVTEGFASGIDSLENPTLEDILISIYGKNTPMFGKNMRRDGDGNSANAFTQAGNKAYGDLTSIIYAVGRLTGNTHAANKMVEDLDEIANDPGY